MSIQLKFYGLINELMVINNLIYTLEDVKYLSDNNFRGLGLLVYRKGIFSSSYHSDLRPSYSTPKNINLGTKECVSFLLQISKKDNPLHDGFIFFDERGRMTHVSQYFAPIVEKSIVPNEKYGTRYMAALYGSLLPGVIVTGTLHSSDRACFIFHKGKVIYSF